MTKFPLMTAADLLFIVLLVLQSELDSSALLQAHSLSAVELLGHIQ